MLKKMICERCFEDFFLLEKEIESNCIFCGFQTINELTPQLEIKRQRYLEYRK
jgi:hypothetical protein